MDLPQIGEIGVSTPRIAFPVLELMLETPNDQTLNKAFKP
jgi:hypothetical protein